MSDTNLYEIKQISSPGEASPDSIFIGDFKSVTEFIPQSVARQDEQRRLDVARLNSAQITHAQEATRALQVVFFCDSITTLTRRLDRLQARRTARARKDAEEREREEEQREAQAKADRIKAALDALIEGEEPEETHGELTPHPASQPAQEEQLEATDQGDLPAELTNKVPVDPGTDPDLSGAREPTARNPVGISW
jgi:hypothetical protein